MLLVVDFNVVFSALVAKGITSKVFELNRELKVIDFICPEFMFDEINKNLAKLTRLSKLSENEISSALGTIMSQVKPVPIDEFLHKMPEALQIDKKDAPYIALSLAKNCDVFSGDNKLKSKLPKTVLSPRELFDIFEFKKYSDA